MVSLVLSAALSALGRWWGQYFGAWHALLQGVNSAVSFVLVTVLFALIYRIMPRVSVKWHDVLVGSTFTAFLFVAGKTLIGLYIGTSGIASGFGAAASLVVMLIRVYYSAQIFLLGAEFTWVYAHAFGSHMGMARPERDSTTNPPRRKIDRPQTRVTREGDPRGAPASRRA
jgi:membrane protein